MWQQVAVLDSESNWQMNLVIISLPLLISKSHSSTRNINKTITWALSERLISLIIIMSSRQKKKLWVSQRRGVKEMKGKRGTRSSPKRLRDVSQLQRRWNKVGGERLGTSTLTWRVAETGTGWKHSCLEWAGPGSETALFSPSPSSSCFLILVPVHFIPCFIPFFYTILATSSICVIPFFIPTSSFFNIHPSSREGRLK